MEPLDILVIDDDANICQLLRLYLEKEGYSVECAYRGARGVEVFEERKPRLLILDIMLPELSGWDVCKEVRRHSNVPILMLTAKGETFDKVLGLELGADDYMVKPFEPKELVARVKALLRRSGEMAAPESASAKELEFDKLKINMADYTVTYCDQRLELPPKEMELFYYLASHANVVFTREQLLEQVWGYDYYGDSRTVDVHVKRLREKFPLDADVNWKIKTVWGVGYKFEVK